MGENFDLAMIRQILFLAWVSIFAFGAEFEGIGDLEFLPQKNLKILVLDEKMRVKKVLNLDSKESKHITLEVEKDEKIYLTIIHKDSNQEDSNQSKKQATENQDKSKLAKALKEEATITNASPNIEKSAYEGRFERNRFMGGILGFEPDGFNYILPANISTSKEPNQGKQTETKFQISIKKRLYNDLVFKDLDLYFAYTQQSFWQLYDSDNSKPFRESNYAPSLYLSYPLKAHDLFFERVNFGYLHQSNGGDLEHSRSWDRIFIEGIYSYENFALSLKAWYRIPEDPNKDDNRDITKYLGYGELSVGYLWKKHLVSATLRNNLRSDNRGSILLDYSYPIYKNLYFYLQFFNGYGESLRDYNNSINRIGVGILFNR